jgi:hypothetical protein
LEEDRADLAVETSRILKLKHALHPLRAAQAARTRLLAYVRTQRFAYRSKRRFRDDPRYEPSRVTEGFARRSDNSPDDTSLLERISKAYMRSVSHPECDRGCYAPTQWWRQIRESSLKSVIQALQEGDVSSLQRMYSNFFRDPCATGLIGVPYGMLKAYFQGPMREVHRRCYMGQALYRIDYWLAETRHRFQLADLAGPDVGNPFGVPINGVFVPYNSEYQHYCAHEILSRVATTPRVVAEVGPGYGGMAHYLLRDGGPLIYIGFDLPETIALSSYYLLKSFPTARFLLYGESDLTSEALAASNIILLPTFAMAALPARSVAVTFSSHVMGDLSESGMAEYLDQIVRVTRQYFLYSGHMRGGERIREAGRGRLGLVTARPTAWNRHMAPNEREGEYVFAHQSLP